MEKRLTKEEKEIRTVEALDRCLDSPVLREVDAWGEDMSMPTDDITRANLKTLLDKINKLALTKGRYDAMEILYGCFFEPMMYIKMGFNLAGDHRAELIADPKTKIMKPTAVLNFTTNEKLKREIGIAHRSLNLSLKALQWLEPLPGYDHLNKELADVQKRLPGLLDEYFAAKRGFASLSPEDDGRLFFDRLLKGGEIPAKKFREVAIDWYGKKRFAVAAKLLREIGDPKLYATLARLTKIIPSIKPLTREAIKERVNRYIDPS